MATKQEIQQKLDKIIHKVDPATAAELREVQQQIAELTGSTGHRQSYNVLKRVLLPKEEYYTVEEAAERFGVSRQAVHKWIQTKKIKFIAPPVGQRKGYLIPKDQFKSIKSRSEEFRRRRNEIFGHDDLTLDNSKEIFRNGEVEE